MAIVVDFEIVDFVLFDNEKRFVVLIHGELDLAQVERQKIGAHWQNVLVQN